MLPSEEVSSEQIEDTMAMLSDMGINVIETEEGEEAQEAAEEPEEEEGGRALATQAVPATTSTRSEPTERTDDPVRMYLREMGSVELLSREGEIAIAKRIEAGREAMIAGLCESPLTFQAIIIWRDELNEGKILLRDIIDLEATYEGPEAKAPPPALPGEAPQPAEAPESGEPPAEGEMDDDDDYENALSLAAMEAELKPKVLETFDNIAGTYKKLASSRTRSSSSRSRARPDRSSSRRPTTSCATRSSPRSRACRSTTTASRAWSSSSTASTRSSSGSRAG